jgi:hypothetical protein
MQTRDRHALPHVGPPGYETALYIAGLAPLVLGGAGPLAVESLIETRQGRGRAAHPIQ